MTSSYTYEYTRQRHLERQRERYADDPEYRKKQQDAAREWYRQHSEQANAAKRARRKVIKAERQKEREEAL